MNWHLPIVFVCFTIALAMAAGAKNELETSWQSFQKKFSDHITLISEAKSEIRRAIFFETHEFITEHNNGNHTYKMAHSQFSIMTDEEKEQYLGLVDQSDEEWPKVNLNDQRLLRANAPSSLDYRTSPCVGAVKNQGRCGSCYVFAAIAPLEYSNCIKNNNTYVALSEEQGVDCDPYDAGCGGGTPHNVWRYIKENNGVVTQSSYPYTAGLRGQKGTCKFNASNVAAKVSSYGQLPSKNPTGMKDWLVTYGPLMVGIAVYGKFQNYGSGVYSDTTCDNKARNHAVVIVGYGRDTSRNIDYWIIRNSWSSKWGQGGYMLIQRGVNKCNMESDVKYVVAAAPKSSNKG